MGQELERIRRGTGQAIRRDAGREGRAPHRTFDKPDFPVYIIASYFWEVPMKDFANTPFIRAAIAGISILRVRPLTVSPLGEIRGRLRHR